MADHIDSTLAALVIVALWITVGFMWIRGDRYER